MITVLTLVVETKFTHTETGETMAPLVMTLTQTLYIPTETQSIKSNELSEKRCLRWHN